MVNVAQTYTRYRDVGLLYDLDLLEKQRLIRIRLIIQDNRTDVITPVTPLYEARFITGTPVNAIPRRDFSPREIDACFVSGDPPKAVHRTVYVPYRPTNSNHLNQIREVLDYPGAIAADYKGETHRSSYELVI